MDYEYIKVILMDLPVKIDGQTIYCGNDTYIILINARLNNERQRQIYDREVQYINDGKLNMMLRAEDLQQNDFAWVNAVLQYSNYIRNRKIPFFLFLVPSSADFSILK